MVVDEIMKGETKMKTEGTMDLWKSWSEVPGQYVKPITGGRLAGKSDINPQWRYMVLTERFGPIGQGWWYLIKDRWTEKVGDETMCFAEVHLYIRGFETPIVGVGGNKLAIAEKGGIYANDEAWKGAVTDALSVCCKMLGIGSRIYEGVLETKYQAAATRANPIPETAEGTAQKPTIMIVRALTSKTGETNGRKWTLTTISGDVDGQEMTVDTFDAPDTLVVGDSVSIADLTYQSERNRYRAKKVTKL